MNDIRFSGIPDHKLVCKEGAPVMLMRNLDISTNLCNGTRLIINYLGPNVISAIVISGTHIGHKVYISRMNYMTSLIVSFVMTINKIQGQTLSHISVYLTNPVFSHGQSYVIISRVKNRSGMKILIFNEDTKLTRCY